MAAQEWSKRHRCPLTLLVIKELETKVLPTAVDTVWQLDLFIVCHSTTCKQEGKQILNSNMAFHEQVSTRRGEYVELLSMAAYWSTYCYGVDEHILLWCG